MGNDKKSRDALSLKYRTFAEAVVRKLIFTMSLPQENAEEYISAGLLGLVEAAERFDPENGSDFRSFAYLRIRGEVIDSIRNSSELSGRAYRYARALSAVQSLREEEVYQERTKKSVNNSDDKKELPKEKFAKILDLAAKGALALRLSFEDAEQELIGDSEESNAEKTMLARESLGGFANLVKKLPPKERIIIEEFYFNEKSFAEIIRENEGFSKSWVSRLHSRALKRLKELYDNDQEK